MVHLENLSHTNFQALKYSEILGTIKTWRHAMYPMYMAVYLVYLTQTMAKLVILLEQAMENANILTNFKKFLSSITVNEEGKHLYQNVHLKLYNHTI